MAGRRLIDAWKLLSASRGVAQQHLRLRSQQLDVYSKTSSLAKAARSQTDRITLTLEAARVLSQRLNEEPPKHARPPSPPQQQHASREGANHEPSRRTQAPPPGGAAPSVDAIMSADQMRAQHQDSGGIPSHANEPYRPVPLPKVQKLYEGHDRDVFYAPSVESNPVPSSTPQTQIPKYGETDQESDPHVRDEQMNQDVYYAVPEPAQEQMQREDIPQRTAVPEQDPVPEGINTDVFRTKRVAKLLGGNPYQQQPHLDMKGAARTPLDHTKLAQGHDQDTFNVRRSEESQPSMPATPTQDARSNTTEPAHQPESDNTTEEIRQLASQLSKDAEAAQADVCVTQLGAPTAYHADLLTVQP